jgi:hypothetical protein
MAHECLAHYVAGSGTPLPAYFSELDAEGVRPEDFKQVRSLVSTTTPDGVYQVTDEMGWQTKSGNARAAYGRVVLTVDGTLTVSKGQYTFEGTLGAKPDKYDFDSQPWGVRSFGAEVSTRLGSLLPGKPYYNVIQGTRSVYSSGTLP